MTVDETRRVLGDYLDALLGGGVFAAYFADDVQWSTTETGEVISGADAVRDFIIAFHKELFDASPARTAHLWGRCRRAGSNVRRQAHSGIAA